jgi:hypothetical protein
MRGIIIFIIGISAISAAFPDIIYDDQTYNYGDTNNGLSIWSEIGYEPADDFEADSYWTLETVRFWLFYSGEQNIRVDIFSNDDGEPGAPPPGDLYFEEVPSGDIIWTDTGDVMFGWPIYEVDVPITGFDIIPDTRYWLGLLSITGDNSFWLTMPHNSDWWNSVRVFYEGTWIPDFFYSSACEFELHGTPDDTAVEAGSFGGIKALYR